MFLSPFRCPLPPLSQINRPASVFLRIINTDTDARASARTHAHSHTGDTTTLSSSLMLLLLLLLPLPVPCAADFKDVGRHGKRLHTHTETRRHTCVHGVYAHTRTRSRAQPAGARAPVRRPHEDVQASRTGGNQRATPTSFCRQYFHYVCVWVIFSVCV